MSKKIFKYSIILLLIILLLILFNFFRNYSIFSKILDSEKNNYSNYKCDVSDNYHSGNYLTILKNKEKLSIKINNESNTMTYFIHRATKKAYMQNANLELVDFSEYLDTDPMLNQDKILLNPFSNLTTMQKIKLCVFSIFSKKDNLYNIKYNDNIYKFDTNSLLIKEIFYKKENSSTFFNITLNTVTDDMLNIQF